MLSGGNEIPSGIAEKKPNTKASSLAKEINPSWGHLRRIYRGSYRTGHTTRHKYKRTELRLLADA